MITETKEVYKCEYCRRMYQVKRSCEKHEAGCKKNPNNHRACHECTILKKKTTYVDSGCFGTEIPVDILYCSARDCYIHPPKVALKGNAFETDKENIEMPKECEFMVPPFSINYFI